MEILICEIIQILEISDEEYKVMCLSKVMSLKTL